MPVASLERVRDGCSDLALCVGESWAGVSLARLSQAQPRRTGLACQVPARTFDKSAGSPCGTRKPEDAPRPTDGISAPVLSRKEAGGVRVAWGMARELSGSREGSGQAERARDRWAEAVREGAEQERRSRGERVQDARADEAMACPVG